MFAASKTAGVSSAINYIEDVFSTYLFNGTGANQTIVNDIDLSTKGGLVWQKSRNLADSHYLVDTVRGSSKYISTESTAAQATTTALVNSFNTNGFTTGNNYPTNYTVASWTFREQAKFFDVVTYTGTGANRTISHLLGSVPGCIIVKRTDANGAWQVYHRSLANTEYMVLNSTAAVATGATRWNSTTPTSTVFSLGTDATVNASGGTYVAYVFAHDAGGFGLTGTDNVISCGSYNGTSTAGLNVTLGYEPQWLMIKKSTSTGDWLMFDNMRGMPVDSADAFLLANLSDAESSFEYLNPTSTGFQLNSGSTVINGLGNTYIYIAIRRGPMKVPTLGTSVYNAIARTGTGANATISTVGFPPDMLIDADRTRSLSDGNYAWDRLRGNTRLLNTNTTDAEGTPSNALTGFDVMNGVTVGTDSNFYINANATTYINWFFKRAPSYMDVVAFTGTGSAKTQTHNLAAVPELMIIKSRSGTTAWQVYSKTLANTEYLVLNTTAAKATGTTRWNSTTPTSTVFSIGTATEVNASAATYIAYLFATCVGVSKVGTYTGNGTTQTIDCGFTGGARFVLIKRTNTTGDWYVYDTARGMTTLTDPYMLLNSITAETASLGSVTTVTTGFAVNAAILAAINTNGSTYIFLAIA